MGTGRRGACVAGAITLLIFGGTATAGASSRSGAAPGEELRELRTDTSRTYRADDGTFVTRIRASAAPTRSRGALTAARAGGNRFCWIASGSEADDRHCDERTVQVGWDGTNQRRALLWFDLSVLPPQRDVLLAELWMYATSTSSSRELISLHTPTRSWGDATGPTWNNADAASTWDTPGGDFVPELVTYSAVGSGLNIWRVTDLAQEWVDGSRSNDGMLLKQWFEPRPSVVSFDVDDDPGNPRRPWLNVTTAARTGEQKRYTYESQPLASGRELGVNVATGNLLLRESDVEFFDTDQDYSLDRAYNGATTSWTDGRATSLYLPSTGDAQWAGPSGERKAFLPGRDGTYRSVGESDQTLIRTASGTYEVADRESLSRWEYTNRGQVTTQVDARGGRLAFTRDVRPYPYTGIASAADDVGRVTRFENLNYRVTTMTASDGGVHRYSYTDGSPRVSCDDGLLVSHTDPAGGVTTYGYDMVESCIALLTDVTWPDGEQVRISYYPASYYDVRVRSVTRVTDPVTGAGETTSYVYGDGSTTSTDPSGKQTTWWYDAASRVTRTSSGAQPPSVTLADDLYAARGTTLAAGEHTLSLEAADDAGVANVRVEVDGELQTEQPSDCTGGCPARSTGTWTLETDDWEGGTVAVAVTVVDGEGSTTSRSFAVTIPELPPYSDGSLPDDEPVTTDPEEPITSEGCERRFGTGSVYCIDPAPEEAQASALLDGDAALTREVRDLIFGISQDGDTDFPSYRLFKDLQVRRVRRIVPYNLLEQEYPGGPRKFPDQIEEFRRFYTRAVDEELDIMVSFQFRLRKVRDRSGNYIHNCDWEPAQPRVRVIDYERTRTAQSDDLDCDGIVPDATGPHSNFDYAPSWQNYRDNVRAFKREFFRVKTFSAWNEPNYRWQPTRGKRAGPRRAALYTWVLAEKVCRAGRVCQVVAGDFAGGSGTSWRRYLIAYTRRLRELFSDPGTDAALPVIWGLHPYGDVERQTPTRAKKKKTTTSEFIDIAPRNRRIWLTEVGSRVDTGRTGGTVRLNTPQEQSDEVTYLVTRLATSRASIARVYYYKLCAPSWLGDGLRTFDSALLGHFATRDDDHPGGCESQPPRLAYDTYRGFAQQNAYG